jgi:hypothetical protein
MNHHPRHARERRPAGRAFVPGQIGTRESSIRHFPIYFLEGKRPELLAVLADVNLHSDLLKETPAKIKPGFGLVA